MGDPNDLESSVTMLTKAATPRAQRAKLATTRPAFSHDQYLPLEIDVRHAKGICQRVRVRTTQEVWYQDAIVRIVVPKGFVSDLASIPRALWFLVAPWDIALESLFHDQLYRTQPVERLIADAELYAMMEKRGVGWLTRKLVYRGVRIFGWLAWDANAERIRNDKA
jgi:Protein of unknown function (DUF1353)